MGLLKIPIYIVLEVLVCDVDLLVRTLLVDLHHMMLTFLHKLFAHVCHVPVLRVLFDGVRDAWVLWEDRVLQEIFRKGVGTHFADGHVNKLRFFVE